MATTYGSKTYSPTGSGGWWQTALRVTTTAETPSSVTLLVECLVVMHYGWDVYANGSCSASPTDGVNDGQTSNSWSGSIYSPSGRDTTAVKCSFSVQYAKYYGQARTVTLSAANTVTGGFGNGTSSASQKVTVAARSDLSAPAAPASCAAERASDARATVTWENGASTDAAPRSAVLVERQEDSGPWVQLASLAASATNYADGTTSANHRYRYRVRSSGGGGSSAYATSDYVYTTPGAPSSVSAGLASGTTVNVTPSGMGQWATTFDVERRPSGSASWTRVATGVAVGSVFFADEWTGTARWRARACRGDLASAWVESGDVTTATAPLAPTVSVSPSGVAATNTALTVSWARSHPDGSAQTQAQVEVTAQDGTVTVVDVDGPASSWARAASAQSSAGTVSFRVRTHGVYDGWGAWSSPVAVSVAARPQAAITSPGVDGEAVTSLPLAVSWQVTDPTGVSSQTLALLDASGAQLWSARLAGSTRLTRIGASAVSLANSTPYRLRLTVMGGSGLSSTVTRSFETDWDVPGTPTVQLSYDGDLAAHVEVWAGSEEGAPETTSLDVWRVLADGTETLLASGLAPGQQCVDRLPPLNVAYSYRVVASTAFGSTSVAAVAARCDSGGMEAFNFGDDASSALVLGYDATGSESVSRSGETFHFALGPDAAALPTFYPDGDLDVTGSHSYKLYGADEYRRAREKVRAGGAVCWFRDAWGRRARVVASWSLSYDAASHSLWDVAADVTEVVWEEPSDA